MKKFDFNQAIQIFANVGVIAGIFFLAIELRQNNSLLRSEARQSQVDSRAGTLERWADDGEMMELRLKASNGEHLTSAEDMRVRLDFASIITRLEHDFELYREGRIEYIPIGGWQNIFRRWPYMRSMWREGTNFSPEFEKWMEENVVNEQ